MHISLELTQARPGRLALGIAASLLAHAILLLFYRIDVMQAPEPVAIAPDESLLVWIKPPPPPVPALVQAPADPARRPKASARPPQQSEQAEEEQQAADIPPSLIAVTPPVPDIFAVQPAQQDKPFDVEAARAAARRIATSPDPARADLPVGQFDKERMRVKAEPSKLARDIAKAERPDCKDGIPGPFASILSPLNLLLDKKDHGCKW